MPAPRKTPILLRPGSRRAFSLVELFTVIAIVGILAAILIPVVGRVRDTARDNQCLANLRALALAHALYRADFRGDSPTGGNITANHPLRQGSFNYGVSLVLRHYYAGSNQVFSTSPVRYILNQTEICPQAGPTDTSKNATEPGRDGDYAVLNRPGVKYDLFYQAPSRVPLFWDAWSYNWNSHPRMPPRHGRQDGVNIAFLDGHAAYLSRADGRLYRSWWDSATQQAIPDDSLLGQGLSLIVDERP